MDYQPQFMPQQNPYAQQYKPIMPQMPQYQPQRQTAQIAPQQPIQQQAPAYSCSPVTSYEEALATPVDYFSLGTVMPDIGHGKIYLKRFNQNTGTSDIFTFSIETAPAVPEQRPEFLTVEKFNSWAGGITQRIERLEPKKKAAVNNDA